MALDKTALRRELAIVFDKNAEGFLGAVANNQEAKARTVQGWGAALEACCDAIVPPSTTLSAARAAFEAAMAVAFTDTTGAAFLAAFQTFAATLAGGMAPAFIGTPPASPPNLAAQVASLSDALDAHANAIVAWLATGSAIPAGGGAAAPWS